MSYHTNNSGNYDLLQADTLKRYKYIYEDVMVDVDVRSCFWERNSLLVSGRYYNEFIMKILYICLIVVVMKGYSVDVYPLLMKSYLQWIRMKE